jgi:hypothetical protein
MTFLEKADGRPQHMFGRTVPFITVKGLNNNFTHLSYGEV